MDTTHRRFPVAVHIFFLHETEVLPLRRFNTGYEHGNYGVVAGHRDGNETVVQAAIREAREEFGVDMQSGDLKVVGVMRRKSTEEGVDFFLALRSGREPRRIERLRSAMRLPDSPWMRCRRTLFRT